MEWLKPHEMRIGNIVQYEDGKITTITSGWELDEGMDVYPIPLTEEWMEKLGFIRNEELSKEYNSYYESKVNIGLFFFILTKTYSGRIICYIGLPLNNCTYSPGLNGAEYVHQLQNLYHSLTGEELEVRS